MPYSRVAGASARGVSDPELQTDAGLRPKTKQVDLNRASY